MTAGTLHAIAVVLQVPVEEFFVDLERADRPAAHAGQEREVVSAFEAIADARVRAKLLLLVQRLAEIPGFVAG